MKLIKSRHFSSGLRSIRSQWALILAALCAMPLASLRAQNLVLNGRFTNNAAAFVIAPGNANAPGNPAAITNWVNINGGNVGLEGSGVGTTSTAFDPTTLGGNTFAFIQGGSNGLSQSLTLAASTLYQLTFDAAAKAGNSPQFQVVVSDSSQVYVTTGSVPGNNAAFTHYYYSFTTPGTITGTPSVHLVNLHHRRQYDGFRQCGDYRHYQCDLHLDQACQRQRLGQLDNPDKLVWGDPCRPPLTPPCFSTLSPSLPVPPSR